MTHSDKNMRALQTAKAALTGKSQSEIDPEFESEPVFTDANLLNDERPYFHNPYHFIPAIKCTVSQSKYALSLTDFSKQDRVDKHSHHKYHEGTKSGRVICSLTTITPIFVGNQSDSRERKKQADQDKDTDQPSIVQPSVDPDGLPMIPGSTLRGMISSITEAASNSSLRVLDDSLYTVRKPVESPLTALGMIVDRKGKLSLRPLAVPTSKKGREDEWDKVFDNSSQRSVPFGSYSREHPGTPLYSLSSYRGGSSVNSQFYHIRKADLSDLKMGKSLPTIRLIRESDLTDELRGDGVVRGILYVTHSLRKANDAKAVAEKTIEVKDHERFIPYPEGANDWKTIDIPGEVLGRFYELCDERTVESFKKKVTLLPYEPRGTREERHRVQNDGEKPTEDQKIRLRDGDIVYFDVRPDGNRRVVSELSFSSIWRERIEDQEGKSAKTYDFFSQFTTDHLPLGARYPHSLRSYLTPAELMFGTVESRPDKKDKNRAPDPGKKDQALAFAGKLRFSYAFLHDSEQRVQNKSIDSCFLPQDKPLQILASPKPPCPSFYFKRKDGGSAFIRKSDLKLEGFVPQGRKFYLHHPDAVSSHTWSTKKSDDAIRRDAKQHVKINPWKRGLTFHFSIDFENLSDWELGLLLYALKPNKDFHHKIGMGKPLGLGSIKLEICGLYLVDRQERYSGKLSMEGRYHVVYVNRDPLLICPPQDRFLAESKARELAVELDEKKLQELRGKFTSSMNSAIAAAINVVGNLNAVGTTRVHYPQVLEKQTGDKKKPKWEPVSDGYQEFEEELFRWFGENEQRRGLGGKHGLRSLGSTQQELSQLPRYIEKRDW